MTGQGAPMAAPVFLRVLKLSDLPVGHKTPVDVVGKRVLICNAGGVLHAISNVCSHAEKPLERGRIGNGWIACPAHGARFELATGKALNLPATQPIATYPVRVSGDWIEVAA